MTLEMEKLREKLKEMKIRWRDMRDCLIDIDRTHFRYKGHKVSVINGFGTFGGINPHTCENKGLLEMMIDGHEPIGYLTCDEVFEELSKL